MMKPFCVLPFVQFSTTVSGDYQACSLQWGPWSGAGMVDESLARLYATRGVRLIALDEGVSVFSREWRGTQDKRVSPDPSEASTPDHQMREGHNQIDHVNTRVILYTWPFTIPSV